MASNIEIQEEDGDEEDDDEVYGHVGVKTRTARHKHPRKKTRPVRRGRRYRLVVLGLGLLCGVQALLKIGLRLSLYSDWTEEKNNLLKDLDQLQSSYNDVTAEKDQIQSSYNIITAERDELKRRLCDGWQPFGSSCYYISTEKKTWVQSRKYCRDNQADLIIINNKEEQDFVESMDRAVWLGLTDSEEEGVWKWIDGTPLTSTPTYWFSGALNLPAQPNDAGGGGGGADCAEHYGGLGWFDEPCTVPRRWMCEKALQ